MTRLRSVNSIHAEAAGLVRGAGKNFEIQTHGRSVYAKASSLETPEFWASFSSGRTTLTSSAGEQSPSLQGKAARLESQGPARRPRAPNFASLWDWAMASPLRAPSLSPRID